MPGTSMRLLLGFGSGALSHITFQGGLSVVFFAAGLIPGTIWSLKPLPPFGVPTTINFAFWAGLWGIVYSLLEPRLTPRLGRIGGGLLFGVAALLGRWLVVLPLKGAPFAEGLIPSIMFVYVGFHLIFGIGLALIYGAALALTRPQSEAPTRAVRS